jgi:dihydroorotate dehydrogenase electron transfer subunit
MNQQRATVLWNRSMNADCFRLGLVCDQVYADAVPGQFVMVQVGAEHAPLLRRPFSIAGIFGQENRVEGIELFIKVVGQGTQRLSQLAKGDQVDLLGPLGRGFKVDPGHDRVYLAAGGIGVAPIRFLAMAMVAKGSEPGNCRVFIGGRNKADLLCHEEFEALGMSVTVTTDDGSAGGQCLLTDPLEVAIQEQPPDMVCACGPHGMLACIAGIAARTQVACQLSIETMMACGLGACMGCAVPSRTDPSTYLHACLNGPVMDAAKLQL